MYALITCHQWALGYCTVKPTNRMNCFLLLKLKTNIFTWKRTGIIYRSTTLRNYCQIPIVCINDLLTGLLGPY